MESDININNVNSSMHRLHPEDIIKEEKVLSDKTETELKMDLQRIQV